MTFLYHVLKVPKEFYIPKLIILNISRGKLISTEARAFIRHAFNAFNRDFAMVDTHKNPFNWNKTFKHAMTTYRQAILRWATSIRIFRAWRQNTSRTKHVPMETLRQFLTLVTFNNNYAFTLTANFRAAISYAESTAATQ